jgi:hypothetical protein
LPPTIGEAPAKVPTFQLFAPLNERDRGKGVKAVQADVAHRLCCVHQTRTIMMDIHDRRRSW